MPRTVTRRTFLKSASAATAVSAVAVTPAEAKKVCSDAIMGRMTGAQALVEALQRECVPCVFGIPGAQANELWDSFKSKGLDYLLCTHEFSASTMADGAARATGRPGVLCVVPGPGITNALTGIGEALLDSSPLVVLAGDVARGRDYRPYQVHDLPQADLLKPVTKETISISRVEQIPAVTRHAMRLAASGEPGPVGVVIPYNLLIESASFNVPGPADIGIEVDDDATDRALRLLSDHSLRVGIYAGQGCMDYADTLAAVAERLDAPVATSVSGKGAMNDDHPLAVGWGYGTQGTRTAEKAFKDVDLLLAIGVKFSEVSTAFYSQPKIRNAIHVDANKNNLGRVIDPDVCVASDAGLFLERVLADSAHLCRTPSDHLRKRIAKHRAADQQRYIKCHAKSACDPMHVVMALRRHSSPDAMTFVDVTMTEHWAAEAFPVRMSRTYFNPTDNQAMGWSIPAALGAQRVNPGRQAISLTGDGCLLMSAMELSTAAREGLPLKLFLLDDGAYHYMQTLQESAYRQTTATVLPSIEYGALATAFGIEYREIASGAQLDDGVAEALALDGPVLVRISTDYGDRPCRWIDTVRGRYIDELTPAQQMRFLGRISARTVSRQTRND